MPALEPAPPSADAGKPPTAPPSSKKNQDKFTLDSAPPGHDPFGDNVDLDTVAAMGAQKILFDKDCKLAYKHFSQFIGPQVLGLEAGTLPVLQVNFLIAEYMRTRVNLTAQKVILGTFFSGPYF